MNKKKRQGSWIGALTLINALFLLLGFLCWTGVGLRNRALNDYSQGFIYEENEGFVCLELKNGENLELYFGTESVKVKDADKVSGLQEQTKVILFIQEYLLKQDKRLSRKTTQYVGEYRLHYFLYKLGYKRAQTKDADLEYEQDSRWYVNAVSRWVGWLGI